MCFAWPWQALPPLELIPLQDKWAALVGEWLAPREIGDNWVTIERVLQGSSYGPSKAILELAGSIIPYGTFFPSGVVFSPLGEINDIIKSSRVMLDLEQDWDGEGASPIAESTWERAAEFMRNAASTLWTIHGRRMESPSLVPAADGSIDLHWKLPNRELLISIPASANALATYYGDDRRGWNIVEGKLDTHAPNQSLFVWLTG
jgi:hypothetical protein